MCDIFMFDARVYRIDGKKERKRKKAKGFYLENICFVTVYMLNKSIEI